MSKKDFKECNECCCIIEDGDYFIEHEGVVYCEDCFYELFAYCERCDAYVAHDDICEVHTEHGGVVFWCEHCMDCYSSCCDDCLQNYDYCLTTTGDGRCVCNNCLDNYRYCEECDNYFFLDNFRPDAYICDDCYNHNNLINSYHNGPPLQKMGLCQKNWRGIWRGIGLELEIDKGEHDSEQEQATAKKIKSIAGDSIYFERDGSLDNGFEIITQPHTIKEFYKIRWIDILSACIAGGYTSHDANTCGLHLHISREFFGASKYKQNNAISKLIYFIDLYYNDILKVSRRSSEDANRWAASYLTKNKQEAKNVLKGCAGRYYAVNNTNASTVEIRIMRGTLNINTFYSTIDFILTLAKNSKIIKWCDIDNCAAWLQGLKNATIEYIKSRKAFGGVVCV